MRRPYNNPQKDFLVLISVGSQDNPMAIVRLEGLGELRRIIDHIGIEPETFWLNHLVVIDKNNNLT
jgi:hypothetical protein